MGKNTCTSCGGSGVVKKNIQQETPNPSIQGKAKEKKSNAQRKKPSKGEKNNGN